MVTGNGPHHSAGCCCRVLKAPSIYYRKCYFLVPRYVHCTFSPRKVSQSVQVELVQGGGVANRGPDSWDIWAPGWSCSHQHSDWIGEKEIPGITLNLSAPSSPCSEWIQGVLFQRRHLKGRGHNSMITRQGNSKHLDCRVKFTTTESHWFEDGTYFAQLRFPHWIPSVPNLDRIPSVPNLTPLAQPLHTYLFRQLRAGVLHVLKPVTKLFDRVGTSPNTVVP